MTADRTLVYDDENQLTSLLSGGVTDLYHYNALGQRYRATLGGTYGRYVYNGDRVLEETNDSGTVQARYTTESPSLFAPLLHMWRSSSTSRFPLYDMTGSARELMDANGAVTDTYTLDAFGRQISSTGSTTNPYKYDAAWGYITDPSGFQQLGARFYWPEVGRFVQQDPVGEGKNWYAYAGNGPVRFIDPMGLWRFSLEGYFRYGGGINFGVNPDGGWFFGIRGGVGIGGGFDFDPKGTSPGWKPGGAPGLGGFLGGSASAGASLGPLNLGLLGAAGGVRFPPGRSPDPYGNISGPSASWSLPNAFRLSVGANAGIDVGFVEHPCPL